MLVHVKIRLLVSMERIARLLAHCIASPKRTMLKENQTKKAAPHEVTVQVGSPCNHNEAPSSVTLKLRFFQILLPNVQFLNFKKRVR